MTIKTDLWAQAQTQTHYYCIHLQSVLIINTSNITLLLITPYATCEYSYILHTRNCIRVKTMKGSVHTRRHVPDLLSAARRQLQARSAADGESIGDWLRDGRHRAHVCAIAALAAPPALPALGALGLRAEAAAIAARARLLWR